MSASTSVRRELAGALLVAFLAGACAASQPLPTYSVRPDASVGGQLLLGTLATVKGSPCIQVKPLGQPAVALLWPSGFTALADPLRIYDQRGAEVAADGDLVTVGGGWDVSWSVTCQSLGTFQVIQITRGEPTVAP